MLRGKRFARFAVLLGLTLTLPFLPGSAAAEPGSPPTEPPAVQPAVPGGFSMVLMSDSQYPWWRGGQDPACNGACVQTRAAETNLDMALGIANITQIGPWPAPLTGDITPPIAVIINGDLTEYWHPGQIDAVQTMYALQPNPIYYGLGNHDYQNNTTADGGSCYSSHGGVATTDPNRCAKQAIAWMADKIGTLGVVNHDAPHFVSMYNDASYIAELVVVHFCNGVFTIHNDAGIGAGNTGTVLIPPCVGPEFATMSFKTAFDTYGPHPVDSFKTNPGTCFRLTGVISNPNASRNSCADARNLPPGASGSMSYSWNVGNYHFVQLHNKPSYNVNLPAGGTAPVLDANAFSVTESYTWLGADLAAAHAAGKNSVVLMHDWYDSSTFLSTISGKNVVAIFGGHIHHRAGQYQTVSNGVRQIPVFYSGSAECRSLIYAEFQPHKFNIGLIDVTNARLGTPPRFNTRARCDERDIWETTTTANYYHPYFSEMSQLGEFGVGTSPDIKVTPGSLDFNKVNVGATSSTQQLTVQNTGPTALNVGSLAITGAHPSNFVKSADTCSGQAVAGGGQCTLRVAFAPAATGSRTATLVIPSNDPDENPVNVALSGVGVIPEINVTPGSLTFGARAVGATSPTQQIGVQNSGTGPLLVGALSITGPNAADFSKSADTCSGQTVNPIGGQCTVRVAFAPTALGARTATLVIPSNDADENPVNIALSGTGTPVGGKNLTITTGSIDLSWDGGTAQTGYTLLKYNTSAASAQLIALPGGATSYSDATATNGIVYCYVLAALDGATVLGLSDLLCGMAGQETGTVIPQGFTLKLGQTANATMTWAAPVGGVDSYLLQVIPLDGTPITNLPLGGGDATTTQPVTPAGTCFQLIAFKGAAFGTSDVLCGVPGVSSLALSGSRVASVEDATDAMRSLAGRVAATAVLNRD